MKTLKIALFLCTFALISACSSDSDSDSDSGDALSVNTGMIIDSAVANIGYRTETLDGVTNALGEYEYATGETVTFFIGDLVFPSVTATGLVTPLVLAGATDTSAPMVINISRLLQTLDADGDPSTNGITITEAAKGAATLLDFSLSVIDFAALPAVTALITNAGQEPTVTELVSEATALAHLEESLAALSDTEETEETVDAVDIMVTGASGAKVNLTGTWKTDCYFSDDEGADIQESVVFSGSTVTYTNTKYTSTDTSCTTGASVALSYSAAVTTGNEWRITEWQNGSEEIIVGPEASDASGPLADDQLYTGLSYTFTSLVGIEDVSVGDTFFFVYVVDDTGSPSIIYRGDYKNEEEWTGPYGGIADPFIKQ